MSDDLGNPDILRQAVEAHINAAARLCALSPSLACYRPCYDLSFTAVHLRLRLAMIMKVICISLVFPFLFFFSTCVGEPTFGAL